MQRLCFNDAVEELYDDPYLAKLGREFCYQVSLSDFLIQIL